MRPASISAVWLKMSWDGAFGGMDVASPRTGFRLIVPPTSRALPDIMMFIFRSGWILLPTSFNGRMPLGLQPLGISLPPWPPVSFWGEPGLLETPPEPQARSSRVTSTFYQTALTSRVYLDWIKRDFDQRRRALQHASSVGRGLALECRSIVDRKTMRASLVLRIYYAKS